MKPAPAISSPRAAPTARSTRRVRPAAPILFALSGALLAVLVTAVGIGPVAIPPSEVLRILGGGIPPALRHTTSPRRSSGPPGCPGS
ncbi:hypothetical protein AB3K78_02355 [Leucobacter sp. HNU]|uniref:hypothetical protein n=1 Tax=Leucobacter sp. HNU TaxID=3236805 RepID=UPI003A810C9D